jgi:methionyl-tRNA formyltransferase
MQNKATHTTPPFTFTFFGSARFSVHVLDELKKAGFMPRCVVTTPDKPAGRKLILTPTPVKTWALEHTIPVTEDLSQLSSASSQKVSDVFVVAAYGKILPESVINLPPRKTLNIHPSLLPEYRGASPLQSAILNDTKNTGVTIMRVDALMDHGPIVAQKEIHITEWPVYEVFEEMMAHEGGALLAKVLAEWVAGTISEKEQDHAKATLTKKIKKEDGDVTQVLQELKTQMGLETDAKGISEKIAYTLFRKVQAYHLWPTTYFFKENNSKEGGKPIRIKITKVRFEFGKLFIDSIIPEGSSEIKATKDFVDPSFL